MPLDLNKLKQGSKDLAREKEVLDDSLKDFEVGVYDVIQQGANMSGVYLVGASDLELQLIFSHVNANTVRYTRYGLEKKGLIQKADIRRSAQPGGAKANVWKAVPDASLETDHSVILLDASGKRI